MNPEPNAASMKRRVNAGHYVNGRPATLCAPGSKPNELWDAKVSGLCLRVLPGGVKTWTFRYRPKDSISFKRLSLGRYPEVPLALARQRAQEKRVEVAGGGDPQTARKAKRAAERSALTFNALADDYLERYAKAHKRSWANDALDLRAHVRPAWAEKPAGRITRADAAALLDGIAKSAPTSANRTQSILSRLFNWAIESGLLEANPLAGMPKRAREHAKDRVPLVRRNRSSLAGARRRVFCDGLSAVLVAHGTAAGRSRGDSKSARLSISTTLPAPCSKFLHRG